MSRTYRHHHIMKDSSPQHRRYAKKWANDSVKNYRGDLSKGAYYKRLFPQWDIYDYWWTCSYEDYKRWYSNREKTEKQLRADWLKECHYR